MFLQARQLSKRKTSNKCTTCKHFTGPFVYTPTYAFHRFSDEGKDLVIKLDSILSIHSFGRVGDTKSIQYHHVSKNLTKNRYEVKLEAPVKQRNNKAYQNFEFYITGKEEMRLLDLYISKIHENHRNGQFLKNFNQQSGKYTQNVGVNNLQKFPKEVATRLKKSNPENYTHHCWRHTSSTWAVDEDFSEKKLQRAGRWKSTSAPNKYIENSSKAKTQVASSMTVEPVRKRTAESAGLPSLEQESTKKAQPHRPYPTVQALINTLENMSINNNTMNTICPLLQNINQGPSLSFTPLWDILANDPNHHLWNKAPFHIQHKALEIMEARSRSWNNRIIQLGTPQR